MRFSKLVIRLTRLANKLDRDKKFALANRIDNYLKILAEDFKDGKIEKEIEITPEQEEEFDKIWVDFEENE